MRWWNVIVLEGGGYEGENEEVSWLFCVYDKKKKLEMPGIEPGAFHMQSERSTTELHPRYFALMVFTEQLCV